MPSLNEAAIRWLRQHHGIATVAKLDQLGVSTWTRKQVVRSGFLVPVHHGVYRIATQPVTLESRCVALCACHPNGFVTGPTAGLLLGLRRMHLRRATTADGCDATTIHFSTLHGQRPDVPGVRVRQSTIIEATDVQRRADGINLASPWRLAFDLAADLQAEDLESVVEQVLDRRLCQLPTLANTARRLARPARPGSLPFVTALASRLPGGPLESHPELIVAKALHAAGVPIVVQTTWLDLPNGRRIRLDISVPEIRWGLEVDVHPDHFLAARNGRSSPRSPMSHDRLAGRPRHSRRSPRPRPADSRAGGGVPRAPGRDDWARMIGRASADRAIGGGTSLPQMLHRREIGAKSTRQIASVTR